MRCRRAAKLAAHRHDRCQPAARRHLRGRRRLQLLRHVVVCLQRLPVVAVESRRRHLRLCRGVCGRVSMWTKGLEAV
eukprot:364267-Chlamydomonas_euryale.AAC.4